MWNKRWSDRELALFSRKLGQLLAVGFGFLQAFDMMRQGGKKRLHKEIETMVQSLEGGMPFSEVLQDRRFPSFYCFLVLSAEYHGRLTETLFILEDYYNQRHKRKRKYQKIFAYPLLVILTCCATFLFIIHALIPQLASLYRSFSLELPWFTQQLIQLAEQKTVFFFLSLALALLLLLLFVYMFKTYRVHLTSFLFRIPIISSLMQTRYGAQVLKQMGYLLDGGIDMLKVCDLFSESGNGEIVADSFQRIKQRLLEGMTISESFTSAPFFERTVIEAVRIFEQTGSLSEGMVTIADQLEEEYMYRLDMLSTLIEMNTLLGAGLFVFLIILALFVPMFDFIQHI